MATIVLWPSILASIGIMGTNWSLAREVASKPDKEADLSRSALLLGLILAFLCGTLGYFLIPCLVSTEKGHLIGLIRVYLLWLPLNFVSLNLLAIDYGLLRWVRYNLIRLSVVLSYMIFLLIIWAAKTCAVAWFVYALMISNLITVILLLSFQKHNIVYGHTDLSEILSLLRQGLPFFWASISGMAAFYVDKAIVVSFLSMQAVGCYAAAFSFASAHGSLGGALGITSFAALSHTHDLHQQGQYLGQVFRQATLLYLGAGTAVAALSPLLICLLFGSDFAPAVIPAMILSVGISLLALGNILNEGLRGIGVTYPGIRAQLLGCATVALFAWAFVPRYGITGMAWATVIGVLSQVLVLMSAAVAVFKLNANVLWGLRLSEVRDLFGRLFALSPFDLSLQKDKRL